jgi:2-dehydro-3-deoxyphosphogalactonate aldolase
MTNASEVAAALSRCPLIAILRGIGPEECEAVGDALFRAGFTAIEVPLNSPEPFKSIERLRSVARGRGVVGAGTVLDPSAVDAARAAGSQLIVSPNVDPGVIRTSVAAGMASLPGYFTPSEAFAALAAGAHGLKLFPAEAATPPVLKAHRAVLPRVPVYVVGGITPDLLAEWTAAGATGFGLGSALYRPGDGPDVVAHRARAFVQRWRALR